MKNRSFYLWVLFFCFLTLIPILPITTHTSLSKAPKRRCLQPETNLKIGNAQLDYLIASTGRYTCTFTLELVGNNQSAIGLGRGIFSITSLQIDNFSLIHATLPLVFSKTEVSNTTFFSFNLTSIIPEGVMTRLEGKFSGTFNENKSGIYSYHLGIDWGVTVGYQVAKVKLDGQKYTIISIDPEEPLTSRMGPLIVMTWYDAVCQGFMCNLELEAQDTSPTGLMVDISVWYAIIGQPIEIKVKNIGFLDIEGYFLPNSTWITTNVSKFSLTPSQEITVLCSVIDTASIGVNGSIEILTIKWVDRATNIYYPSEPIVITVYIIDKTPMLWMKDLFSQLIPIGLISIIAISAILVTYQKDKILLILQNKIRSITNPTTTDKHVSSIDNKMVKTISSESLTVQWQSIHSKWKSILPERELQLLRILFFNGNMNQQALADKLNLSKGTVSRIISRLETKRFLTREQFGMSNLVKLNREKFYF